MNRRYIVSGRRSRLKALGIAGIIALSGGLIAACSPSSGAAGGADQTTAIVPMTAGMTPDQIFPLMTGAQYTVVNMQDFQWLMYRPLLWYGGQPGNEFGINRHARHRQGRAVRLQPSQS
jgi:hypothetical protein